MVTTGPAEQIATQQIRACGKAIPCWETTLRQPWRMLPGQWPWQGPCQTKDAGGSSPSRPLLLPSTLRRGVLTAGFHRRLICQSLTSAVVAVAQLERGTRETRRTCALEQAPHTAPTPGRQEQQGSHARSPPLHTADFAEWVEKATRVSPGGPACPGALLCGDCIVGRFRPFEPRPHCASSPRADAGPRANQRWDISLQT